MNHGITKTEQAAAYLCRNLPDTLRPDLEFIQDLLYLVDWKSSLEYQTQVTELDWFNSSTGPFAPSLKPILVGSRMLTVTADEVAGCLHRSIPEHSAWPDLTKDDQKVLNHVLGTVRRVHGNRLNQLVYSTFPMLRTPTKDKLDLRKIARDYKEQGVAAGWSFR